MEKKKADLKGAKHGIVEPLVALAVPIDSVKPDPKNPRRHPERNIEAIKRSLVKFGQRKPIVVRESTRTIEAGHGVWQAAKELGWTHIAAVFVNDSDADAKAFAIADNKTTLLGDWEYGFLEEALRELKAAGYDLAVTGFEEDELTVLISGGFMVEDELTTELNVHGEEDGALVGETADRYVVCLSFDSMEAANRWLEENGFEQRIKKGSKTVVVFMD